MNLLVEEKLYLLVSSFLSAKDKLSIARYSYFCVAIISLFMGGAYISDLLRNELILALLLILMVVIVIVTVVCTSIQKEICNKFSEDVVDLFLEDKTEAVNDFLNSKRKEVIQVLDWYMDLQIRSLVHFKKEYQSHPNRTIEASFLKRRHRIARALRILSTIVDNKYE